MDQILKDSSFAGEGTPPETSELDITIDRLRKDRFLVKDKEMLQKLEQLVLDEYQSKQAQSRGTQTFGGRFQTPMDDLMWNEQMKYTKRSLETLMSNKSKTTRKSGKSIADYFDANATYDTLSSEIKDRFTTLNLKLIKQTPEDFKIWVDCKHFRPNEIKVVVKDGCVVVHAQHDVKLDEHGLIKREFQHCWTLPEEVKSEKLSCLLDKYGILTIRAPCKPTSIIVPVQTEKPRSLESYDIETTYE
ncbi:Alpha-crystallin A chain like protein [Argiope bruennichi]|uniref:Alpha-crystallin A chain like protein n=1 Tax=Argiope bruennichi TaxID=94029 RepID=A0A8T0FEW2_ARGBR|nr:Alpha-crystallin A chain like protein [Argiope bruennichi]